MERQLPPDQDAARPARTSAVERLAADRAKYVRARPGTAWSSASEGSSPAAGQGQAGDPRPPARAPGAVARRAIARRPLRPDSLVIYRQKCEFTRGQDTDSFRGGLVRKLFPGPGKDKTAVPPETSPAGEEGRARGEEVVPTKPGPTVAPAPPARPSVPAAPSMPSACPTVPAAPPTPAAHPKAAPPTPAACPRVPAAPPTSSARPKAAPPTPAAHPKAAPPTPAACPRVPAAPPTSSAHPKAAPPTPAACPRVPAAPPTPAAHPKAAPPTPAACPRVLAAPPTSSARPKAAPPTPAACPRVLAAPPTSSARPKAAPPTPAARPRGPASRGSPELRAARRRGLQRSQSDLSSRFSMSAAEFDAFFQLCGLEPEVVEALGRENFSVGSDRVALKVRSVSVATSDSGFSRRSGGDEGLQEEALTEQVPSTTSVVERNARIIKWLYTCRKAKETPAPRLQGPA